MKLGTLTTGAAVVTTLQTNYLPAWLYFVAATGLTSIKIEVSGDGVVLDLDTSGIASLSGIRRFGAVTNSYLLPLADGLIPGKVVNWTFTNSAAQTPDIFGFSLQRGTAYIKSTRIYALAGTETLVEKFAHLGFDSTLADTDILNVSYVDGHIEKLTGTELKGMYTIYSNEIDAFAIDNVEHNIDNVRFIPGAARTLYKTAYVPVGGQL